MHELLRRTVLGTTYERRVWLGSATGSTSKTWGQGETVRRERGHWARESTAYGSAGLVTRHMWLLMERRGWCSPLQREVVPLSCFTEVLGHMVE